MRLTQAAIVTSVAVTLALAAVPWPAMGNRPSSSGALTDQLWLEIASDLEGEIPAKELLGARPVSPPLVLALRERGIDADFFRSAAEEIRRRAMTLGGHLDDPLMSAVQDAPLPDGVIPPPVPERIRGVRNPALDLAALLLEDLAANPSLIR